ncbi:MAG: YidC/Oxa1 family insertase periplasmic-domain containing protein [Planctomycetes bacterium]|nr:YidC/Oxa1 family insertase periplasmic-domain containing protein [Planctomycetota bacterium]
MAQPSQQPRYRTFFALVVILFLVNMVVTRYFFPQPPAKPVAKKERDVLAEAKEKLENDKPAAKDDKDQSAEPDKNKPAREVPKVAPQWYTLGSVDHASPFRMLVTFNNQGGAIERVELNGPRYHESTWDDLYAPHGREDLSGYMGHLALTVDEQKRGLVVNAVGDGTPAARAGIKVGDILAAVNDKPIRSPADLDEIMHHTRMRHKIAVTLDGKADKVEITLGPRPMQVIRPEGTDPLSYLLTMQEIDRRTIDAGKLKDLAEQMRTQPWEARLDPQNDTIEFNWPLVEYDLDVIKRYRLVKAADADKDNLDAAVYHLEFYIGFRNLGDQPREVAFRLDGPSGLPAEGSWYSSKISTGSGGLRDVTMGTRDGKAVTTTFASTVTVAGDEKLPEWDGKDLAFAGVDAHYFASALIVSAGPRSKYWTTDELRKDPKELDELRARGEASNYIFDRVIPLRAGPVPLDPKRKSLTNVTCRLQSFPFKVLPRGEDGKASEVGFVFGIFAGPKRPDLLEKYSLDDLVDYGWFGFVAKPMSWILHKFYELVRNYGLAIIMLTVLVRSCMFPISRKQALNAQKMQELQPEIKRIAELYKKDLEARNKAQQELFRKHKYNPLAGCLPVFLQLPIFIGLYRSLSLDVELRQAPLLSEAVRWCSNLSAPDMFWFWQNYLPEYFSAPTGWLGPYLNVLPLVTIALFIVQQKMFMPPPTDEQTAMQQKIMKYMMVFMGVMFFKVASGLCIYFIASSLWGLAERKLLPKPATPVVVAPTRPSNGKRRHGRGS